MMIAHIMGIPVEETFAQLAPAGAVVVSFAALGVRAGVWRLLDRYRSR